MRRRLVYFTIATLVLFLIGLLILSFQPWLLERLVATWLSRPPDPTPSPPTIIAPRDELPTGNVGLQEWALYAGESYRPIGSGFLLQLSDGTVIGVTTAHAVGDIGDPANTLQKVALGVAGVDGFVIESDTLFGVPGLPRLGDDLTLDYVLLKIDQVVDPSFVLKPDPRGVPQLGERVSLFSGLGDGHDGRRIVEGTVQSVDANGFWVLMDKVEYPGGMSGSPLVSNHTGQVVGMAIAVQPRGDRYLIGFHPIGSVLAKALTANMFPTIDDYTR